MNFEFDVSLKFFLANLERNGEQVMLQIAGGMPGNDHISPTKVFWLSLSVGYVSVP